MSHEKIIWISSTNMEVGGTTNNFNYLISGCIEPYAKNVTVQLLNASVSPSTYVRYFQRDYIKILINFNASHNQYNQQYSNYLVVGLIAPMAFINYYSENLEYPGPIYKLSCAPNSSINIFIVDYDNVALIDNTGAVPKNVLLCLKFTYEI